jgi:hypothetical protein
VNNSNLRRANARRVQAGAARNAALAGRLLVWLPEQTASTVLRYWREVAEARATSPEASWAEVAEPLGLSKWQAASAFRRALAAAGLRDG